MNSFPIRSLKRVKLKGKVNFFVREQYLRDDVPCHSPLCAKCSSNNQVLYKAATHYAIPSFDVMQQYLEILELPEIKGVIILQSVGCKVLQGLGRGHYRRLLSISHDSRRGCGVFLNEICAHTNCERLPAESEEEWLIKCTLRAAQYYTKHLEGALPIIVVTENPKLFEEQNPDASVKILNLKSYLSIMWSDLKEASDLYDSIFIASSVLSSNRDSSKLYENHLPVDVLESGVKGGRYIKGILRVNKHLPLQEAYVASSVLFKKDFGDVLISGMKDRNRAIHGDDVVIELLPRSEWKGKNARLITDKEDAKELDANSDLSSYMPTGRVVGILQRRWRDYVATLPDEKEDASNMTRSNTERLLVVPYDYRVPKIRIATMQADLLRNQRIIVRIDRWEKDSQYPSGHFVRTLGEIGALETEVMSVLVEHEIPAVDFPPSLLPELPESSKEMPWTVDEVEVARRKDLRNTHLIFSIDPKGCEDVDDALSVRNLLDGNIELGVHIADVTYFVRPSSLVDLEARSRSTSVYLPDRRYDMLPHVLSGDLCSLLGNVDRYAVSVIWHLDSNFEVQDVWYGRTVIRSSYKLCYEDAESILNGETAEVMQEKISELQHLDAEEFHTRFSALKSAVFGLVKISKALREKRLSAGGLELNNINMKFEIDKTLPSVVTDFRQVVELEVHKTVAECMIFANYWVARQISQVFPQQAVMRRHPLPQEHNLQELQKLAFSKGYTIKIGSNKELAQSLHEACDQNDPSVNQIFLILATRAMNEAVYFCSGTVLPDDFYHYGLGISHYTHFTSPIRRYSDVLVHHLLLASVEGNSDVNHLKTSELESFCVHMNERHRSAQHVEQAAQELFQAFYFSEQAAKKSVDNRANGIIYSVKANGVLAFIPQYGLKGAVQLLNKEKKVAVVVRGAVQWVDGCVEVDGMSLTIKAFELVQKYSVFDKITVCIVVEKSKSHQPKISIKLVSNEPYINLKENRNSMLDAQSVAIGTQELLRAIILTKNTMKKSTCHQFTGVIHSVKAKSSLSFFSQKSIKDTLLSDEGKVAIEDAGVVKWVEGIVEDNTTSLVIKSPKLVQLCSGFDGIMICVIGQKETSPETKTDPIGSELCHLCTMMRKQCFAPIALHSETKIEEKLDHPVEASCRCPPEAESHCVIANGVLVFIPRHGVKNTFGWINSNKNAAHAKKGVIKRIGKNDAVHWFEGLVVVEGSSLTVRSPALSKSLLTMNKSLVCVVILKQKSNQTNAEPIADNPFVPEECQTTTEPCDKAELDEWYDEVAPAPIPEPKVVEPEPNGTSLYHLLQNFRKMTLSAPSLGRQENGHLSFHCR